MENILLKYMVERFNESDYERHKIVADLPFVTISREYGCPSKDIAALLVLKMNILPGNKDKEHSWRMINKEILEDTSKELKINTKRIQKFYNLENKSTIDEILNSLSEKYYQSENKIKKTLTQIIRDFAKQGNVVLVGRGGVGVTGDLMNGIHIRLTAPIEWRAEQIVKAGKSNTIDDAKKLAAEIDNKRNLLIQILSNKSIDNIIFDLTYNCRYFSNEEIAASILYHLELKGKIKV